MKVFQYDAANKHYKTTYLKFFKTLIDFLTVFFVVKSVSFSNEIVTSKLSLCNDS